MQAFHSLFHAKPGPGTLPAELNAQIITVRPGVGRGRALVGGGEVVLLLVWGVRLNGLRWAAPLQETGHQNHISTHRSWRS